MTLGERIAYYRGALGLSQGELAEKLGGAEAAHWYYPVASAVINLLAAAVVLLTVREIIRAGKAK